MNTWLDSLHVHVFLSLLAFPFLPLIGSLGLFPPSPEW